MCEIVASDEPIVHFDMDVCIWTVGGEIIAMGTEVSQKSPSQCQFVQYKSYMNWPGIR
jgi:hypothetical protein